MSDIQQSENQYVLHDAIHGTIDLKLLGGAETLKLSALINSAAVQRLRNIKQLGFAYLTFQSADHSRYSHAIGTMYLADKIFKKVEKGLDKNGVFEEVKRIFKAEKEDVLKYILVAALLQDIGELPFGQATNNIIRPSEELRKQIINDKLKATIKLDDKQIFTLAIIYKETTTNELISKIIGNKSGNFDFLSYLLVGAFNENLKKNCNKSNALRNILDGVVDADRLDYVYRDAHHTFGNNDGPGLIISSLTGYDNDCPIFNDTGPISDFFLKRWHLWNNVYFAPENRFNSILLKEYLKKTNIKSIGDIKDFHSISLDDFLKLDDFSLWNHLKEVGKDLTKINSIQVKKAIENLLLHKKPYEWFWIENKVVTEYRFTNLPDEIFYDSFSNYKDHKLYKLKSVKIESNQYKNLLRPVFLEDCSGTFGSLIEKGWETLPHKKYFLVFEPLRIPKVGKDWQSYKKALKSKILYDHIYCAEDEIPDSIIENTIGFPHFSNPIIFISYSTDDSKLMEKVVKTLFKLKYKYLVIMGEYSGAGKTKEKNCYDKMKEADIIIVLCSKSYLNKMNDDNTGVAIEFNQMMANKTKWKIKLLGIEGDHNSISSKAWENITDGSKVLSYDLKQLPLSETEKAVIKCLKD